MKNLVVFVISICVICIPPIQAQDHIIENTPKLSVFHLLQFQDMVKVTIKTDLDSLIANKKKGVYQPATFIYTDANGQRISHLIKVKPRGKYRKRVCDFPVLKLNFSKKKLNIAGLALYDDYKLVTHCLDDGTASRENILREYLVYKIYNILTEKSYRVQLLNITYVDQTNEKNTIERLGFLIEDTGELKDRIKGSIDKSPRLPIDSFDVAQYNYVALFQYMVGNVDWRATPFTKNIKVFKAHEGNKYELIPYDFDFSGVVGPAYMRLSESLNQKDYRQRIFLGHLDDQNDLSKQFQQFHAKEQELLTFINNFSLLSKGKRKDIKKYIASFYEDIADGEVAMK